MKFSTAKIQRLTLCLFSGVTVWALSACGGGGDGGAPPPVQRVFVMGDSLSDVGTFGRKATVQNSDNLQAGYPLWTQTVSTQLGVDGAAQCPYFDLRQQGVAPRPQCTNIAVGGGRISPPASLTGSLGKSSPFDITHQMSLGPAQYQASDVVLLDGGGNDIADLVGAYLGAAAGTAQGVAAYRDFLLQQLSQQQVTELLSNSGGAATAAQVYMLHLAQTFHDSIQRHVLNRQAGRVVVMDIPDVTLTPRFQLVLSSVAQAQGAQAAGQLQVGIRSWITTYNSQLKGLFAEEGRVVWVSFFNLLTDAVAQPAKYSLTNATTPACPVTGQESSGMPIYDFAQCTSAALNAAPPTGVTGANWFSTYLFSDGFHPTPRGHDIMAQAVLQALKK